MSGIINPTSSKLLAKALKDNLENIEQNVNKTFKPTFLDSNLHC